VNNGQGDPVRLWLNAAAQDLEAARWLWRASPDCPESAAFHCEQAASKALRAYLAYADTPFASSDGLPELLDLASTTTDAFEPLRAVAAGLAACARTYLDPTATWPDATEYPRGLQEAAQEAFRLALLLMPPGRLPRAGGMVILCRSGESQPTALGLADLGDWLYAAYGAARTDLVAAPARLGEHDHIVEWRQTPLGELTGADIVHLVGAFALGDRGPLLPTLPRILELCAAADDEELDDWQVASALVELGAVAGAAEDDPELDWRQVSRLRAVPLAAVVPPALTMRLAAGRDFRRLGKAALLHLDVAARLGIARELARAWRGGFGRVAFAVLAAARTFHEDDGRLGPDRPLDEHLPDDAVASEDQMAYVRWLLGPGGIAQALPRAKWTAMVPDEMALVRWGEQYVLLEGEGCGLTGPRPGADEPIDEDEQQVARRAALTRRICEAVGRDPDEPRIVYAQGSHEEDYCGILRLRLSDLTLADLEALATRGGTTLWDWPDIAWAMPALLAAVPDREFDGFAADIVLSKVVEFDRGWGYRGSEPLRPEDLLECQRLFPVRQASELLAEVLWLDIEGCIEASGRHFETPAGRARTHAWLAAQVGALGPFAERLRLASGPAALAVLELCLAGWRDLGELAADQLYWQPDLPRQGERELRELLGTETMASLLASAAEVARTPEDRALVTRAMEQLRADGHEA